MCCLRYEHEFYKEAQRRLPAVGAILQLPQGRAKVIDVNVVSNVITCLLYTSCLLTLGINQESIAQVGMIVYCRVWVNILRGCRCCHKSGLHNNINAKNPKPAT